MDHVTTVTFEWSILIIAIRTVNLVLVNCTNITRLFLPLNRYLKRFKGAKVWENVSGG